MRRLTIPFSLAICAGWTSNQFRFFSRFRKANNSSHLASKDGVGTSAFSSAFVNLLRSAAYCWLGREATFGKVLNLRSSKRI